MCNQAFVLNLELLSPRLVSARQLPTSRQGHLPSFTFVPEYSETYQVLVFDTFLLRVLEDLSSPVMTGPSGSSRRTRRCCSRIWRTSSSVIPDGRSRSQDSSIWPISPKLVAVFCESLDLVLTSEAKDVAVVVEPSSRVVNRLAQVSSSLTSGLGLLLRSPNPSTLEVGRGER